MPKRRTRRGDEPKPTPEQEDRAWASYSQQFRSTVMPQLLSSAVFLAIYDGEGGSDAEVRFATNLGMMLLYDKPIILTVLAGVQVPHRLARVADEIVELDPDMGIGSQDRVAAAMRRWLPTSAAEDGEEEGA